MRAGSQSQQRMLWLMVVRTCSTLRAACPLSFFFLEVRVRYHYEKPGFYTSQYGEVYICDHPVYNRCTLYKNREKGLAVIQQRVDAATKTTWWGRARPMVDGFALSERRVLRIFREARKAGFGRSLPNRDRSPADVGAQDEAACEGTLGDRVRSARNLQFLL